MYRHSEFLENTNQSAAGQFGAKFSIKIIRYNNRNNLYIGDEFNTKPLVVNSKLTGILYRYPLGLRHHHQLFLSLSPSLFVLGFLAIVAWSPLLLLLLLLFLSISMMTLGNTLNMVGPLKAHGFKSSEFLCANK